MATDDAPLEATSVLSPRRASQHVAGGWLTAEGRPTSGLHHVVSGEEMGPAEADRDEPTYGRIPAHGGGIGYAVVGSAAVGVTGVLQVHCERVVLQPVERKEDEALCLGLVVAAAVPESQRVAPVEVGGGRIDRQTPRTLPARVTRAVAESTRDASTSERAQRCRLERRRGYAEACHAGL